VGVLSLWRTNQYTCSDYELKQHRVWGLGKGNNEDCLRHSRITGPIRNAKTQLRLPELSHGTALLAPASEHKYATNPGHLLLRYMLQPLSHGYDIRHDYLTTYVVFDAAILSHHCSPSAGRMHVWLVAWLDSVPWDATRRVRSCRMTSNAAEF